MSTLMDGALKISFVVAMALIANLLLKQRSAALRHWVLAVAVACAMTIPALSQVLPPWLAAPLVTTGVLQDVRPTVRAPQRTSGQTGSPDTTTDTEFSIVPELRTSPVIPGADAVAQAIWLLGSAFSLLILIVGLARLRWLAAQAHEIDDGRWLQAAEELRRAHGLSSRIRLLQSDHLSLLVTWGWRRPTILLPAVARDWPEDRIRIVLAHELAHIVRRDWGVQLAAGTLRAIYWFNPLLWIACRRLRVESERACDDAVLASGVSGPEYATHLLAVARSVRPYRQPPLPAPAMARSSSLEGRIRAMLNTSINRRPASRPARVVTIAALLALTVLVAALQAQPQFYSLTGTVLDSTDRVLPEVRLVLTNSENQAKHEVRTDAAGRFEFVGLPPAEYTLEARLAGFAGFEESIAIAQSTERQVRLRVASLEETIRVTDGRVPDAPPDAATLQRREQARRRFADRVARERARCATGGAATPVGGRILPPAKLVDVRPLYPEHLRAAGIGGTVTMDAIIGTGGLVRDVRNLAGDHPELEQAAADAVRQWQFSTTLLNCEPIDVAMAVTVSFHVQR